MTNTELAQRLRERVGGAVREDEPLGPLTTFRVGGPADVFVEAESEDDLVAIAQLRGDADVAIVGRGSNLLVSDAGFRGIAIKLGRSFRVHEVTDDGLALGGSVYLPAAARLCVRLGLAGFEFAAEIPATFGGAVRMNAGAHDRSMSDVLVDVDVVDLDGGERRTLRVDELGYAYRHSALRPQEIVTRGRLHLERGDPEEIAARVTSYLDWRRQTQPPGLSAGSVFKNPPGDSAGRLIDAAGGKGMRVGGAEVSAVHANFIVASPEATASDIHALIVQLRELVASHAGVELEPEVRFLGAFV